MNALKPNQSLFLWRMITGTSPEVREPKLSEAKPALAQDRKKLLDEGYLDTEKRGRSSHILLTNKAWEWAATTLQVELLKSNSRLGAEALEGLLHRLLPFLKQNDIPLAALFMPAAAAYATTDASSKELAIGTADLRADIIRTYLSLSGGRRKVRVLLRDLRPALPHLARAAVDETLKTMQREGNLVLYREDNSAALTAADTDAALIVGDSPRHLIYLED